MIKLEYIGAAAFVFGVIFFTLLGVIVVYPIPIFIVLVFTTGSITLGFVMWVFARSA